MSFLGPYTFDDFPVSNPNKPVKTSYVKLSYLDSNTVLNLADTVPVNSLVVACGVKVYQPFNRNPTIQIGSNFLPTKYATTEDFDLKSEGIQMKDVIEPIITTEQPRVTFNSDGSTEGELLVVIFFSEP
jgi:hypothetical protein